MGGFQDMKSSLPLEIAVYFNRFYSSVFFIVMLLIFIYKGVMLPYPPNAIGLEVAFVFFFGIVEWARLNLASRGNKLELIGPTLFSLCLAAPVVAFYAYMIRLQTYVLRLDQIINGIGLAFVCWEVVFEVLAIATFWRAQRF